LLAPEAAQLVARAQSGDRTAFDRLVDESYAMIYATAYRLTGDLELAADAAQDAYVRAYNSLQTFRGSSSFTTWMYRIVVNVSLDALRRRSRAPEPLTFADDDQERELEVVDTSPDPHAAAETRELQRTVARAIQELCWCCLTSTGSPTRRSPRSSGCRWGQSSLVSTGPGWLSAK
jgi:RNA polymerase sigma-70 factor (ECF subfamily)